jgi:hypothetical protein
MRALEGTICGGVEWLYVGGNNGSRRQQIEVSCLLKCSLWTAGY